MEINNNGRLNVKVGFDKTNRADDRQRIIADLIKRVQTMYPAAAVLLHEVGRIGTSKTVASFEISLAITENRLRFAKGRESTVDELLRIVHIFYAPRSDDA
jgi:hypothetical protein